MIPQQSTSKSPLLKPLLTINDQPQPQPQNNNQLSTIPLPRPRLWKILPILAILDLTNSIVTIILTSLNDQNRDGDDDDDDDLKNRFRVINLNRSVIFSWTLIRSVSLLVSGSSRRIRSLGWVYASTGMISILLLLWCTNEFIQTSHNKNDDQSLRGFLIAIDLMLIFPLMNWLGFLISVGINNQRNPFVGSSLGFRSSHRDWEEQVVEESGVLVLDEDGETVRSEEEEEELLLENNEGDEGNRRVRGRSISVRKYRSRERFLRDHSLSPTQHQQQQASTSSLIEEEIEEEEEEEEEEEDPDEILDLPAPRITPLTPGPNKVHNEYFSNQTRNESLNKRKSWSSNLGLSVGSSSSSGNSTLNNHNHQSRSPSESLNRSSNHQNQQQQREFKFYNSLKMISGKNQKKKKEKKKFLLPFSN